MTLLWTATLALNLLEFESAHSLHWFLMVEPQVDEFHVKKVELHDMKVHKMDLLFHIVEKSVKVEWVEMVEEFVQVEMVKEFVHAEMVLERMVVEVLVEVSERMMVVLQMMMHV
ncbi:hypothetical protein Tco_1313164 [Tanacetum coccineum]